MKKILCVTAMLAILVLCTSGLSLAKRSGPNEGGYAIISVPATLPAQIPPPPPGTLPGGVMVILGDVVDHLQAAYATHNYDGLDLYMTNAEVQLAQAIGATDKNDVKAWAHFDPVEQVLQAKVMIRADALSDKKLEADMHVQKNEAGLVQVDIKVKGDITEQQKAYAQLLMQLYQKPGVVINLRYL